MNRILSFGLVMLLVTAAHAQLQVGARFGTGPRNLATYNPVLDKYVTSGSLNGIQAGVFGSLGIGSRLGVQAELLYATKGSLDSLLSTSKINLNYITVPIMARIRIIGPVAVEVGPEFGFLYLAQQVQNGNATNVKAIYSNAVDLSLNAGLVLRPFKKLRGGLRYSTGLSNVTDLSTVDVRNRVTTVYLEYAFLGK